MPARTDLEFVTISDFSPGIHDDWFAAEGEGGGPLGAAQVDGTYGCVSDRSGGLQAGPRRVNRLLQGLIESGSAGTEYPASHANVHVTAFRCLSPVWDRTGRGAAETGAPNPFPDDLAFCLEYYRRGAGTPFNHHARLRVYKMFLETAANPSVGSVDTFDAATVASTGTFTGNFLYGWGGIEVSRSNKVDAEDPGYPVLAMTFTSNREVTAEAHVAYPDNDAPTTDASETMAGLSGFGGFTAYALLAHQDRICALQRSVNVSMGLNGELPTEILIAAAVNDYSINTISPQQYVAENPSGFGSWVSMNASMALFIKQLGGGFALRGAIEFPTIIRLPGLTSTYDAVNIGCMTRDGLYVYGSREGVFGWSGGDTSQNLSSQLDGWFWRVSGATGMDRLHYTKGSFASVEGYVFAPNNFFLDLRAGGWWRLANPDDGILYCWHGVSAAGYLIAAVGAINATQTVLADYYDLHQGQSEYQWVSQPLAVTRGRVTHFREISVLLKGHGTVTITLEGIGGATDQRVFTVDSDKWVAIDQGIAVQGHDIVVTILSEGEDSDTPAPSVKRPTFGYESRMTAR